jgi:hypothetical protein
MPAPVATAVRGRASSVAPAAAFSPLDLSPAWWLDAGGSALWQDSARTTAVASDGDPVGAWDDRSGNGRHPTQATAAKRATYKTAILNGLPVLRLDGVDDFLSTASVTLSGHTGFTLLAVAKIAAAVSYGQLVVMDFGRTELRQHSSTRQPSFISGQATVACTSPTALTDGLFHVWAATFDLAADALEVLVDGTSKATATEAGVTNASAAWAVGARPDGTLCWNGDVAEVLAWGRRLSPTDLADATHFLGTKYALTVA